MYYFEAGAVYQCGQVSRLDEPQKFEIGWASQLAEGETIIQSVWACISGSLTIGTGLMAPAISGSNTTAWAAGAVGLLNNSITTSLGRVLARGIGITLSYPDGLGWVTGAAFAVHTGDYANPHHVTAVQAGAFPVASGVATGPLNMGGFALWNFRSGGSAADVLLDQGGAVEVARWTASGYVPSSRFYLTFGCRATVWTDALVGPIDCRVGVVFTTDAAGVATLALVKTPVPNTDGLPDAFSPVLGLEVDGDALVVSVTRPFGVTCKAWCDYWFQPARLLASIA